MRALLSGARGASQCPMDRMQKELESNGPQQEAK
jgi:hypothetical protein